MLFTSEFRGIDNYNTKIRGSISFAQQQARNAIECFRTSYKGMKPQEDNPPTITMRADPQTIHNPSLYILEQKEIARKEKKKSPNVETEKITPLHRHHQQNPRPKTIAWSEDLREVASISIVNREQHFASTHKASPARPESPSDESASRPH